MKTRFKILIIENTWIKGILGSFGDSRIQVIIPKLKYVNQVRASKYADRGIIPDYQVIPDLLDYVTGRDVTLQYTLDLIGRSKR
ncbi:hypothetical protein [Dyadobacter psychrotolerans]|uniref:Uncharacterized protein n=1 Tax=Dyadobacter psychrotolerans TaxID=2541721 RepID=A0A4V2Z345_9BACT|nr:hypothetical protein [Dyadobacter psychrotolerans]TDE11028.1 hypothetical protein E0F88_26380 [Dyadobacter psychrotolerans]